MRTTLVAFILLLIFNTNVSAQFGMVDNSFGVDGKVITNIDYITGGSCVAVQKNGRILAGTAYLDFYDKYDFYLTRFL
jgi:hypothetical protein